MLTVLRAAVPPSGGVGRDGAAASCVYATSWRARVVTPLAAPALAVLRSPRGKGSTDLTSAADDGLHLERDLPVVDTTSTTATRLATLNFAVCHTRMVPYRTVLRSAAHGSHAHSPLRMAHVIWVLEAANAGGVELRVEGAKGEGPQETR